MAIAMLLGCLALAPQPVDTYTLSYFQENFLVRKGEQKVVIPRETEAEKKLSVAFRRDKNFAVWDDRGLTLRSGDRVSSTRLAEYVVSPRLFKREEILENLKRITAGERRREASALSGSRRIGSNAYFLIRWDDRDQEPWLEALVSVDLNDAKAKPKLLGRFDGLSTATRLVDDRLGIYDGKLGIVIRKDEDWGLATYAAEDRLFDFRRLGQGLLDFRPGGLIIDRSPYGTTLGSEISLVDGQREVLFESRGPARFVDDEKPRLAVIRQSTGPVLRNLDTGGERPIQENATIRRQGPWVLVWTGGDAPKAATVYEMPALTERARWIAKP